MANEIVVSHFGIEQRIFAIRGIQVMIDRDLAQKSELVANCDRLASFGLRGMGYGS